MAIKAKTLTSPGTNYDLITWAACANADTGDGTTSLVPMLAVGR